MTSPNTHPMARAADDPGWSTPAEVSGYRSTPDYAETMAYLERIAAANPDRVRIEKFGTTGEGRDLQIVVTSADGVFDPRAIHDSGRVVLLVQNAIHAGEMDGKDACLALLRDLVRDDHLSRVLRHIVWVFIPVYNADGHERRSRFNRINQHGPEVLGWRANATNLNLNRDYLKAEAPETRAFLRMFHRWLPDFFIDNHVTDGADFQYDVTFAVDTTPDVFPATANWIDQALRPELVRRVDASGHLVFPNQVFLVDESDPSKGLAYQENPPRFSTGQMILENRPGLLVELHMLKEYSTRVGADYELMRAVLKVLDRDATQLIALNRDADRAAAQLGAEPARSAPFPLVVGESGETTAVEFRGIEFTRTASEISGGLALRYGQRPWNSSLPLASNLQVLESVHPPAAYIVPPQWTRVIEVLEDHGLNLRRTTAEWTGVVERYRCSGMQRPSRPFEGHYPILRGSRVEPEYGHFGTCTLSSATLYFPAGSAVVRLDQRLSKVAIHWLEPAAPDSALRWGLFDPIFEQKESGEPYVVEEMARNALESDPNLGAEFARRIESDQSFAKDPIARRAFFYDRSPWAAAQRIGEYPVGRLRSLEGIPLS